MCGIFCHACRNQESSRQEKSNSCLDDVALTPQIRQLLASRGPNCFNETKVNSDLWDLHFAAAVLWLQGKEAASQPAVDSDGNILLWNGDVFNGLNVKKGESDTTSLLIALQNSVTVSHQETCKLLGAIEGPWSFIFWCAKSQELWFGRDFLGRHSLLWNTGQGASALTVTSCGERGIDFKEVPAVGIFVAKFTDDSYQLELCPWENVIISDAQELLKQSNISDVKIQSESVPHSNYSHSCLLLPEENDHFVNLMKHLCANDGTTLDTHKLFQDLLNDVQVNNMVEILIKELKAAVEVRCKTLPAHCKNCISSDSVEKCRHSKMAVLFSGGLDSAVVAVLAHLSIDLDDSIDLINVAFPCPENNATGKKIIKTLEEALPNYSTPDRITGRATYSELVTLFPDRHWNFIEVNITIEQLKLSRSKTIADLIYPLNSILDDSLGCALWFAARGHGTKFDSATLKETNYVSPANVLLLGTGADELFGGYSKFRKCFEKSEDWEAVARLLAQDLARIPYRNLGRDDRVVSDSGRQPRFPFLAENCVRFISSLPAHWRTAPYDFLPRGIGEKLILRLAAFSLGLNVASKAPKRALQFGSKIANLEGKKEQGHHICQRLML